MGQIDKVYLAGGFGKHVNLDNLYNLNILPISLKSKTLIIGNSSLSGAVKYLFSSDTKSYESLLKKTQVYNMSEDSQFNELFINYIKFN